MTWTLSLSGHVDSEEDSSALASAVEIIKASLLVAGIRASGQFTNNGVVPNVHESISITPAPVTEEGEGVDAGEAAAGGDGESTLDDALPQNAPSEE